eukprot:5133371-Prymnesium_polylepis.2
MLGAPCALSNPFPKSSPISRPSRTMFDHQASSCHGGVGKALPSQTERAAKYSWNERCDACTLSGESCSRLRSGIRSCLTRFNSEASAASPFETCCAAVWRSWSVMARDLRQCAPKKTAWSSARSAALLLAPARASIASIATSYSPTTVFGISSPSRSSKIDATMESIKGLDVIFCPVSPSVGTRSRKNGISPDAFSLPSRCPSASCCCASVSGDSSSRWKRPNRAPSIPSGREVARIVWPCTASTSTTWRSISSRFSPPSSSPSSRISTRRATIAWRSMR